MTLLRGRTENLLQEELALRREQEEQERLEAEERVRQAKKPRHQDLEISVMADELSSAEISNLAQTMQSVIESSYPRRVGALTDFVYENEKKEWHMLYEGA